MTKRIAKTRLMTVGRRPTVSAIIPCYNEERYVRRCIGSLLQQSYRDFEIIFVDDGSKDKTLIILKQIMNGQKEHGVVRVYRQKNAGLGAARNRGARLAKGRILVFVDADMTFDKDYLRVLTRPIIEGMTNGTTHTKEFVANKENLWARSWCINRIPERMQHQGSGVYRAILRTTFLRSGGFDTSKGYFDDDLSKLGLATPIPAICYHNNPETLHEVFRHSMWVGRSLLQNAATRLKYTVALVMSLFFALFIIVLAVAGLWAPVTVAFDIAIALLILFLLWKTLPRVVEETRFEYLVTIPILWIVRLVGHYLGAWQMLLRQLRAKR